ncbi:MAG: alpha/beta hydrolase [Peptidiphaga gingivicola]
MKWSDITDWEESTLETEYQQLCIREKEAEDWGREILELNKSTSWQGDARKAADKRVEEIDQDVAQFIVNLRAMKTATSTMQQGMGAVQGLVRDAKAHAEGSGLTIYSDGTVEDTSGTDWGDVALSTAMNPLSYALPGAGTLISAGTSYEMNKAARQKAVDECADRVDEAVKKANEIDEAYSQALSNIEEGKVKPEGSLKHTVDGPLPMPQDTSDTRAVAEWWDSLSREEQERLADEEPDRIGNLDGVDAWARDRANRHRLDRDYEDLNSRKESNEKKVADYEKWKASAAIGVPAPCSADEYNRAKSELDRQAELDKLKTALKQGAQYNGTSQLLLYDPVEPGENQDQLHAAVTVGDVDKADNVAVHVGGLTTSVDNNVVGYTAEMANVAGTAGGNTASVMWFGYDPPQAGAGSNGLFTVSETERAAAGGADLSHFLEGLHDSRQGSGEGGDPRITALGHSYGSTTLGYALTQVRDGVVDAGVFYGPPGVPAKDVSDFNVPSDSVYVMKNDQDIIGAVPNKGPMGMAPGSDMTQLSDPTEVPGIQHIEGNHGIDPGTGLVTGILGPIAGAGYEGYQDHVNYFDSTNYQDADTQKEIHKYLRQQGLPETDENVRAEIQRRQQENATSQQREVSKVVNGTK